MKRTTYNTRTQFIDTKKIQEATALARTRGMADAYIDDPETSTAPERAPGWAQISEVKPSVGHGIRR